MDPFETPPATQLPVDPFGTPPATPPPAANAAEFVNAFRNNVERVGAFLGGGVAGAAASLDALLAPILRGDYAAVGKVSRDLARQAAADAAREIDPGLARQLEEAEAARRARAHRVAERRKPHAQRVEERRVEAERAAAEREAQREAERAERRRVQAAEHAARVAEREAQREAERAERRRVQAAEHAARVTEREAERAAEREANRQRREAEHAARVAQREADRQRRAAEVTAERDAAEADRQRQAAERAAERRRRDRGLAAVDFTDVICRGELEVPRFDAGRRSQECAACKAKLWPAETKRRAMCCSGGKVALAAFQVPPEDSAAKDILDMWARDDRLGQALRKYARAVNNALALASQTAKFPTPPGGGWSPTVVIQGKAYFNIGALRAAEGEEGSP